MERKRILQLAVEELRKQKEEIEAEIKTIQAELGIRESRVARVAEIPTAPDRRRRSRTPAERKAQAKKMREYWAAKRGKGAKPPSATKSRGAGAGKAAAPEKKAQIQEKKTNE